jgi:hypothetical protein
LTFREAERLLEAIERPETSLASLTPTMSKCLVPFTP